MGLFWDKLFVPALVFHVRKILLGSPQDFHVFSDFRMQLNEMFVI